MYTPTLPGIIIAVCVFILLAIISRLKFNRAGKVRKSNPEKEFELQCKEFIDIINMQDDFVHLIRVHERIDEYFGNRPFAPNEYILKSKVYKIYYEQQSKLLPRSGNNSKKFSA